MIRLCLLVALLGACGGPDITGMYQVTSHTLADDCVTAVAVTDGQPFFQISKVDFLGTDIRTPQECESQDEASCSSFGFFTLLTDEVDDGYEGQTGFSSGGGTSCSLTFFFYSATVVDDVLTFRSEQYGEVITSADCDADEAISRGDDMPCLGVETIVATRVE